MLQKQWLQNNDQTVIFPSQLYSCDCQFLDEIQNAAFSFRLKSRNKEKFRVLTIEGNCTPCSQNNSKINPLNLYSQDAAYKKGIEKTHFNWRWITTDDGNSVRVVTIENNNHVLKSNGEEFAPNKFIWLRDECQQDNNFFFNWRWYERDGVKYRVVTIEGVAVEGSNSEIVPLSLYSLDKGFTQGVANTAFCWRWVTKNHEQFRILTIEEHKQQKIDQQNKIHPLNLSDNKDFTNGIQNTHFNWRLFKVDNGKEYKTVTIEDCNEQINQLNGDICYPTNFIWSRDDCEPEKFKFHWRWLETGGSSFRVVTLETDNSVVPSQLWSEDSGFNAGIATSGFRWRWKTRNGTNFRVLTIEGEGIQRAATQQKFIPLNLCSKDPNFTYDIVYSHFNWRWIEVDNGQKYKVVTIENSKEKKKTSGNLINPTMMKWSENDCEPDKYTFNWRWFKREDTDFRVVTLE